MRVSPGRLADLGNDLRGQQLGVFGQREQGREQDQFRPGRGDLAYRCNTAGRGSGDRGGLDAGHPPPIEAKYLRNEAGSNSPSENNWGIAIPNLTAASYLALH